MIAELGSAPQNFEELPIRQAEWHDNLASGRVPVCPQTMMAEATPD